jgi:hypothetical protein
VHEQTDRPKLRLHHRPVEIERKFLVSNDEWRRCAVGSVNIRDGLIAASEGRKVRVRISGDMATIVIKGPRTGLVRPEFEYETPLADAERILARICGDHTLEKQRFFVEDAGVKRRSASPHLVMRLAAARRPRSCSCARRSWRLALSITSAQDGAPPFWMHL